MRTVRIPEDYNPFIIHIGNNVYSYKAGETLEVPDEVADVIDTYIDARPVEAEPVPAGYVMTSNGDGSSSWMPVPTPAPYVLPQAKSDKLGGVKLASAVADATDDTDVITQLNALIASLVASGALAQYVAPSGD